MYRYSIVPPYLLQRLAASADSFPQAAAAARAALDDRPDGPRTTAAVRSGSTAAAPKALVGLARTIFDAAGSTKLPGREVRTEGRTASDDVTVNEAYDGLGDTYRLFREEFGRNSIDGAGLPLLATVHYGNRYDNAYWDGHRMVFGDGDGEVFGRFTASVSVIGHELTHGVTEYTAGLVYRDQPGALNESVSDVFGVLVEQYALGQTASEASWLIGAGLFTEAVQGEALRSMKAPGTAYDDDQLGKDPQPTDMAHYIHTEEDEGGVHLNSGIPNRAFYLTATEIGGNAWDAAGHIWYDTISGTLSAHASFADFAAATVAASTKYGAKATRAVTDAWRTVGVTVKK